MKKLIGILLLFFSVTIFAQPATIKVQGGGSGSVGSLQQVTTIGNVTTLSMYADSLIGTSDAVISGLRIGNNGVSGATLFGVNSGNANTSADLTSIGYQAGASNIGPLHNTFIGYQAGTNNTTGNTNTFTGWQSGFANTTGISNTFYGNFTGRNTTTGSANNFIGHTAGSVNISGSGNTAQGNGSYGGTYGNSNSYFGFSSGLGTVVGYSNTGIGTFSGRSTTTGIRNTSLGDSSLYNTTTGSYNIAIGFNTTTTAVSTVNGISLGTNAIADDYQLSISDSMTAMRFKNLDSATGTAPSVIGKSGDGKWHVYATPSAGGSGTVTSVAALTLGTTGTDLSSSVANGTTTPVITLNVPTASASNRGALSAADWTTFNGKQAPGNFFTRSGDSASYINLPNETTLTPIPTSGVTMFDSSGRWSYRTSLGKTVSFSTSSITSNSGIIDSFQNKSGVFAFLSDSAIFDTKFRSDTARANIYTSLAAKGTVTTVSVTTANGVSGSVATATTTPAITLTLGAITPTTVNGNTFTTGSSTYTGTAAMTYTMPDTTSSIARMPTSATTAANDTTTLDTQKDITSLTIWARANKKYRLTAILSTACDNTGGLRFAIAGPTSSAIKSGNASGSGTSNVAYIINRLSTMGTLTAAGSFAYNRVAASTGSVTIIAFITTGATAGPIRIQWAVTTLGQLGTITGTMDLVEEL